MDEARLPIWEIVYNVIEDVCNHEIGKVEAVDRIITHLPYLTKEEIDKMRGNDYRGLKFSPM